MRTVEALAARILFIGGVTAVAVMALGIAGFLWRYGLAAAVVPRGAPVAAAHVVYTSVPQLADDLTRWPVEPLAVVATGILVLLATPMVAVIAAFSVYAGVGDRRYAAIAAVLIVALTIALVVAGGR